MCVAFAALVAVVAMAVLSFEVKWYTFGCAICGESVE